MLVPLVSPMSFPCHFFFRMCFYHHLFCLTCMLLFQPNNALPPLWKIFLAWLFREFSWIAFFLQAACGREIEWRTSHFVLRLGGKAERLQEKCQDLNNHCCWTEMNTELLFIIILKSTTHNSVVSIELVKGSKSNSWFPCGT